MYELFTQVLTVVRGMWRYRWFALLLAWLICVAGWIVVLLLPDQYEARARVYIDTQSVLKPLLRGLTVETDYDDKILMMTRALLSRPNLESVIRETDLGLRTKTEKDHEDLIKHLQTTVRIDGVPQSRERVSNFYTISCSDVNAAMAKRIVQALLNTLVEETLGSNRVDTENAQQFLAEQIKDYEERLTKAEQRLADFKKEHVGLMPNQGKGYYERMQAVIDQLDAIESRIAVTLQRRDELSKQLRGEKQVIGSSELESKIIERKGELSNLLLRFTREHPDVIALEDIIKQLEEQRLREVNISVDDKADLNPVYQKIKITIREVELELATLRAQESDQKRQLSELKKLVDTIPEVEAQLARLNRSYEVTKKQYEALVQRLESAKLSEGAEQSGDNIKFRIIDPPVTPLTPSGPNRFLLISLVLLAGLAVGVALAFLLNELYPVFSTSDELTRHLGLPTLGVVTLKWSPEQKLRNKRNLVLLISAFIVLVLTYASLMAIEQVGIFHKLRTEQRISA